MRPLCSQALFGVNFSESLYMERDTATCSVSLFLFFWMAIAAHGAGTAVATAGGFSFLFIPEYRNQNEYDNRK